jgi:hypothetical protein
MDTCEPYRKHIFSIVAFTARCIATEVIRLLPAYSLSRECVYSVFAQQLVYKPQYQKSLQLLRSEKRREFFSGEQIFNKLFAMITPFNWKDIQ